MSIEINSFTKRRIKRSEEILKQICRLFVMFWYTAAFKFSVAGIWTNSFFNSVKNITWSLMPEKTDQQIIFFSFVFSLGLFLTSANSVWRLFKLDAVLHLRRTNCIAVSSKSNKMWSSRFMEESLYLTKKARLCVLNKKSRVKFCKIKPGVYIWQRMQFCVLKNNVAV